MDGELALATVRITEFHACHSQLLSCTSAHSGLDVECLLRLGRAVLDSQPQIQSLREPGL